MNYYRGRRNYFVEKMSPKMELQMSEYMLGEKMPDSPDTLVTKGQLVQPNGVAVTHNTHKCNINQSTNGTLSPPPSSVRTPSPPPTSTQSTSPQSQRLDNSLTAKGRQVMKVKRFLSTLQQFASGISAEASDTVHELILGLVGATVSIEEFHRKIQEVTNYPLRPFAIPFLKTHLPVLQTEILHFSRMAKQSPQQYLRYHEHVLLDTASTSPSVQRPTEPFEIFQSDAKENAKRRSPINRNVKRVPDFDDTSSDGLPPSKRHQTLPSPNLGPRGSPAAPSNHLPSGHNFRVEDPIHHYRDIRFDRYERFDRDRDFYRPFYGGLPRDYVEEREMEEEWRNIHTMLSCILGMVEKTKRALAILQHRSYAERAELSNWPRLGRHLDPELDHKKAPRPPDIVSHYKVAEDRVSEVRRRAEDAVNEVKRQAVAELQKAVSAAETKAQELVASERLKMERLLAEARRQAAEDALAAIAHQEESNENCWNCGRKAHETCSGCNVARYCGSFCQHKNWDTHHKVCGQTSLPSTSKSTSPTSSRCEKSPSPLRTSLVDVKNIKTDIM